MILKVMLVILKVVRISGSGDFEGDNSGGVDDGGGGGGEDGW
jgi:hypothetical protein